MLFSYKMMVLLCAVVGVMWAQAANESPKAGKAAVEPPAAGAKKVPEADVNTTEEVEDKMDPRDTRSSACVLLYFARMQKDTEALNRFKTDDVNQTIARFTKIKAMIVGKCNKTIPQDLAVKVPLMCKTTIAR